ncbi:MAG: hypothetical protein JO154_26495 [Chitinophaga sp.]|uniref:hypothetical protein n=1 Tax=Chitinophaga sp. TaxID=1869181 RepID=UPI0025BFE6CF|nr:hypothetical protein [Chitinophaga sp.]MBV8256172.1 hypothetical protein [Chitinophaga sp.]
MMSLIPNTKGIFKIFISVFILSFLSLSAFSQSCTDWAITAKIDSASCLADGKVAVKLTGFDANSLTSVLYYLDPIGSTGGTTKPGQTSDTLKDILPGIYKLKVTAICSNQPTSKEMTIEVPGSYAASLVYSARISKDVTGKCANGAIQFTITGGRMPYRLRILKAPAEYTGSKEINVKTNVFLLSSLPKGDYECDVLDTCNVRNGTMKTTLYPYFSGEASRAFTGTGDCDAIIGEGYSATWNFDDPNYFVRLTTKLGNNITTPEKIIAKYMYVYDTIMLPAGKKLKDYYDSIYTRIMTNSCGDSYTATSKLIPPSVSAVAIVHNCNNTFNYQAFYKIGQDGIAVCWPITLTLTDKNDNSKIYSFIAQQNNSGGWVTIKNIPYGNYFVTMTTADGTPLITPNRDQGPLNSNLVVTPPPIRQFSISAEPSEYNKMGYDRLAQFRILSTTGFPAGTKITLDYPFSPTVITNFPDGSSNTSIAVSPQTSGVSPGYYVVKVSTPCDTTLLPVWVTESDVYRYYGYISTEQSCAGLKVTGTVWAIKGDQYLKGYYSLFGPNINTSPILTGSYFTLTTPGDYKFIMGANQFNGLSGNEQRFTYKIDNIKIDTIAGWVCPNAADNTGRILIVASGGPSPGKYTYSLAEDGNWEKGPYLEEKDNGFFVGNATYKLMKGKTYQIKVSNCEVSYPQSITISEFQTNQLITGENTLFCLGDKIKLKANNLPLKAKTYHWDGLGIEGNNTREMQQLTISNASSTIGGTYTVTINTDMCNNPIVASTEIKMAESYRLCYSTVTDTFVNPVRIGMYGNWHPSKSYVYYGQRDGAPIDSLTNIRKDGTYSTFAPFWQSDAGKWKAQYDTAKWVWNAESTIFNLKGFELENKDPLGRYNAGLFGYADALPVAVIQNSRYSDAAFDGFEDYFMSAGNPCEDMVCAVGRHFDFSDYKANIDTTQHHTGRYSMRVNKGSSVGLKAPALLTPPVFLAPTISYTNTACGTNVLKDIRVNKDILIPGFTPVTGKQMLFSVWIKEEQPCNCTSYSNTEVMVYVGGDDSVRVAALAKPTGVIIDGWQRYEQVVRLAKGATGISFSVKAIGNTNVYFDDMRFHPYNANMKSYVYDAQSLRLMAELDENNYATFYEYDDDGTLVRVKKETERGVKTISETRSALLKENEQ